MNSKPATRVRFERRKDKEATGAAVGDIAQRPGGGLLCLSVL